MLQCRRLEKADGEVHPDDEHFVFNKARWVAIVRNMPTEDGSSPHTNLYDELADNFRNELNQMGFGDLDHNINFCDGKLCLIGVAALKRAHPNDEMAYLQYSPQVDHEAKDMLMRSYVNTSLVRACSKHRTKRDRRHLFAWNKVFGKRATGCLVSGRFWTLLSRVGLTYNGTPDLASTPLPLPIHTAYEITWRSRYIHDADFVMIYTSYDWIRP